MSKNFELMQQSRRPETAAIPQPLHLSSKAEEKEVRPNQVQVDWRHVERDHEDSLRLVKRIFLLGTLNSARVVLFAGLSEGSSSAPICLPVAEALKSVVTGSVCIVEANFRSPSLASVLGATKYGFTDALVREGPIRSFAKLLHSENLWFLPSGSVSLDSPDLLRGERIKTRFDELRREFDYLIVDGPSLTQYADLTALGQLSDGFVLVLEANATRKEVALSAIENLRAAQIQVVGAVVNRRTVDIPEVLYKTATSG